MQAIDARVSRAGGVSPLLLVAILMAGGGSPFRDHPARAADPTADPDLDGVASERELVRGTDPLDPDTDRDGLLDGWEIDGADFDGDGRIDPYENLAALGADPLRPDVFVEIDWVVSDEGDPIPEAVLDRILRAIRGALAPGRIALHADVQAVPAASILESTAGLLGAERGTPSLLRAALHAIHGDPRHFPPWRRRLFYHVVVSESRFLRGEAHSVSAAGEPAFAERFAAAVDRAAGFADAGAMALLILRDRLLDPSEPAVTVLHELGHAFGLGHGGAFGPFEWDDANYKPNYESVMNYANLLDGLAAFSAGLAPAIRDGPPLGLGDGWLRDHDDIGKLLRDGFDGIGRNAFRGAEGLCEREQTRLLLERGGGEPPLLLLRGRGGIALIDGLGGVPRIAARIPEGSWPAPWTGDRILAARFDGAPGFIAEGIPAWRAARIRPDGGDPISVELRLLASDPRLSAAARGPLLAGAFTRRDRPQFFLATIGGSDAPASRFAVLEVEGDRVAIAWESASAPFAVELAEAVGPSPGLSAADLDGDGFDDLLLRDRIRGRAALLLGGAEGLRWARIASPATKDPPPGPETGASIFAADVDGDGARELIAAAPALGGAAGMSLRFAIWKLHAGRLSPRVIVVAPLRAAFDGDRLDAAVGRFRMDADGEELVLRAERTLLLLGERRGRFEIGARADAAVSAMGLSGREYPIAADGRMVAVSRGASAGGAARGDLLLQDASASRILQVRLGAGGFEVAGEIGLDGPRPAPWVEGRMLAADVDGDGDEDLLLRRGELNALYRAKGARYVLAWIGRFEGEGLGWRLLAPFRRGDANGDGRVDIGDAVAILYHLFDRRSPTACEDAMDADDSGDLTIADPIAILTYIFLDGRRPPEPGPHRAGFDPTEDPLDCAARILDASPAP